MQDIEFTIENENYIFYKQETGNEPPQLRLKLLWSLAKENRITKQEALLRVTPDTIDQLIHPVF